VALRFKYTATPSALAVSVELFPRLKPKPRPVPRRFSTGLGGKSCAVTEEDFRRIGVVMAAAVVAASSSVEANTEEDEEERDRSV
jgi:hypothetical protein